MTITHIVKIRYLLGSPPGELAFELEDVPYGHDKLSEVFRSIADTVEKDQQERSGNPCELVDVDLHIDWKTRYERLAEDFLKHAWHSFSCPAFDGTRMERASHCGCKYKEVVERLKK